jgi:hypothetical protein
MQQRSNPLCGTGAAPAQRSRRERAADRPPTLPRARPAPPPRPACGEHARSPTINKANAQHGILFEAIALCLALDTGKDLLAAAVASLGRFLSGKVRARVGASAGAGRGCSVGRAGWGAAGGCCRCCPTAGQRGLAAGHPGHPPTSSAPTPACPPPLHTPPPSPHPPRSPTSATSRWRRSRAWRSSPTSTTPSSRSRPPSPPT